MTSDAKIGLLLGLVFIFVIAFVINGLPSLRPPISKVGATTTSPINDEDFSGVTRNTDQALPNWTEGLEQQRTGGEKAPAVAEAPKTPAQEPPQTQPEPTQPTQPPTASNENIRSILTLPGMDKLLNQLPTIQKDKDEVSTVNLGTPKPAFEPPTAGGRQPVTMAPQLRSEPVSESKPPETPATMVETPQPSKPATAANKQPNIAGGKVYTTVDGDSLPVIARKMYGPVEGNRYVNIQRIYHANEGVLQSPDIVHIGQKLTIPPLPKPTATAALGPTSVPNPDNPADVLPQKLFEKINSISEKPKVTIADKVESLAKRAPATMPAPTPEGRLYTVQDGDKLWKIAATQLGAGSRWDEIYKLNSDILADQNSLKVGTRLRLPAK